MAYVQPNTIIEVMENIPITPSYNDTLYFASYSDQNTYFTSNVKYTFSNQMYQRVNKNTCRVEKNAENLYGCNYMRFKNYAYGNKWFYAFITQVEYINDNVSEITYEIDELQTWFFDMVLGECYVEREHSTSDNVGEHLLPEPVDIGDGICQDITPAGFSDLSIVLSFALDNS